MGFNSAFKGLNYFLHLISHLFAYLFVHSLIHSFLVSLMTQWTAQTLQSDVRKIIVQHSSCVYISTNPRYQSGQKQTGHTYTCKE